jgi:hypothetical protein
MNKFRSKNTYMEVHELTLTLALTLTLTLTLAQHAHGGA